MDLGSMLCSLRRKEKGRVLTCWYIGKYASKRRSLHMIASSEHSNFPHSLYPLLLDLHCSEPHAIQFRPNIDTFLSQSNTNA
jgi:hypothetical protein